MDALLSLLESGNIRPTAREIADEAGTSLRSVYVHFDDLEDLFCAASQRQGERIRSIVAAIAEGPFEPRLAAFVAQRQAVWETTRFIRTAAALQEPFSPALATIMAATRAAALAEVAKLFAPELAGLGVEDRAATLSACDALSSGPVWDHWRFHQRHSIAMSAQILSTGLRSLLGRTFA